MDTISFARTVAFAERVLSSWRGDTPALARSWLTSVRICSALLLPDVGGLEDTLEEAGALEEDCGLDITCCRDDVAILELLACGFCEEVDGLDDVLDEVAADC